MVWITSVEIGDHFVFFFFLVVEGDHFELVNWDCVKRGF